jgi:hypothetical protein
VTERWSDPSEQDPADAAVIPTDEAAPAKMDTPRVTLSSDETEFTITWTEPEEDPAIWDTLPVTGYNLVFGTAAWAWFASPDACVQSSSTDLTCTISVEALEGEPWYLTEGWIVRAKVQAINAVGEGEFSEYNAAGGAIPSEGDDGTTTDSTDTDSSTAEADWVVRWPDWDYTVSTCTEYDYDSLGDCLVVPMPRPDHFWVTGTGPTLYDRYPNTTRFGESLPDYTATHWVSIGSTRQFTYVLRDYYSELDANLTAQVKAGNTSWFTEHTSDCQTVEVEWDWRDTSHR